MGGTIERRIRRTVLGAILVTLLITIASVLVANENLEHSMLELGLEAEQEFLLEHLDPNRVLTWDSASLKAYFVPTGMSPNEAMPEVFRGYPFPFSGEVSIDDAIFLMISAEFRGGRLYVAKDITLFEQRETEFHRFLALMAVVMVVAGLILARITGRRLVAPIRQLTAQIRHTPPARRMRRLSEDYRDDELRNIAHSFNLFLGELESYVKREQSLLGLASHELRTPIAIMSGALDVVQQRRATTEADTRSLERMRRAVDEMAGNIDVILRLTRRAGDAQTATECAMAEIVAEVLEDIGRSASGGAERVNVDVVSPVSVTADRVLVKMLLRNLIQNAIEHTSGPITVSLEKGAFLVRDSGAGLPAVYLDYLAGTTTDASDLLNVSGLGLFIVTLICERLGWQLSASQVGADGNVLRVGLGDG